VTRQDRYVYWTTIVPIMLGWIEQWYGKVPLVANVTLTVPFAETRPESNAPVSDTISCTSESPFDHVTTVP
jgi:hypothetical protein